MSITQKMRIQEIEEISSVSVMAIRAELIGNQTRRARESHKEKGGKTIIWAEWKAFHRFVSIARREIETQR